MKTKALVISRFFFPSYRAGGPPKSLKNLVRLLEGKIDAAVICGDRDLAQHTPYEGVSFNTWANDFHGSSVYYSSQSVTSIIPYLHQIKNYKCDTLYLNSFFDFKFAILPYFLYQIGLVDCERLILAPRGELSQGALSIKTFKKKMYLWLFNICQRKEIFFHVTSEAEKQDLVGLLSLPDYRVLNAPNMHGEIPLYKQKIKTPGVLDLIYTSRISPKKNLKPLLEALSNIYDTTIRLKIFGQIDDAAYWASCRHIIDRVPNNIRIEYFGAVEGDEISSQLAKSHVFVLPTLNENYGHSIVEAMVNSNLILISDMTPWSGVEKFGSAVVKNHNSAAEIEIFIREFAQMNQEQYQLSSRLTYDYIVAKLSDNEHQAMSFLL